MMLLLYPGHEHNVVGRGEAEGLPHFVGDGLGALDEHGVPVVAGVGDLLRLPDRLVRDLFAGAVHELDLGSVGAGLEDLGRRGGGGNDDLGADTGSGGVGGHRGTAVA